ncbi:MAG TPA: hypothetical protein VJY41_09030 [Prolixibacteraceae bacterium]|nr:hypothetical protein [Prolixibacteraceae bacterium]
MLRYIILFWCLMVLKVGVMGQAIWAFQLSTISQLNTLDSKYHKNIPNFGGAIGVNVAFPLVKEQLSLVTGVALYDYYFRTQKAEFISESLVGLKSSYNINQSYNCIGFTFPIEIVYESRYIQPFIGFDLSYQINNTTKEDIVNSSGERAPDGTYKLTESYISTTFTPFTYYAKSGVYVNLNSKLKLKIQYSFCLNNYIEIDFKKLIVNEEVNEEEFFNSRMHRFELGMVYYPSFKREKTSHKPINETLKKLYR